MAFQQYIKVPTIVDLKSIDKVAALTELAQTLGKSMRMKKIKPLIDEMLKREEAASTFIGQGLAIPQTRGAIKDPFAIAIGRSIEGVNYDAARNARAHIIVLVISRESDSSGALIERLSEIASFFKTEQVQERILSTKGPVNATELIASFSRLAEEKPSRTTRRPGNPVINSAVNLVRDMKAKALVVFSDAVTENDFLDQIRLRGKTIVVSSNKSRFDPDDKRIHALIQAPSFPGSRTGQMKIGVLLALSRNLIQKNDRVVCVSGNSRIGLFDTVVSLDVGSEYEFFFTAAQTIVPQDVKPEVLERVLGLAGEIAVEGREGKPTGTIFVLGDTNTVNAYIRQLIINPFRGYSEAERNILNPGLDETIKEFASIDGAFVITGDGIVLSAGSYLRPQAEVDTLPSGFGARHAAAAGITACTNALAITISESTGMVSMFKGGSIMMTISKPIVRDKGMVQKIL
jgi:DNA integrity scanning protein DisA with diadenylate cyclase activity/mannitol/fructose-specific phosphotransferase system IIA component (Ntr-type)